METMGKSWTAPRWDMWDTNDGTGQACEPGVSVETDRGDDIRKLQVGINRRSGVYSKQLLIACVTKTLGIRAH